MGSRSTPLAVFGFALAVLAARAAAQCPPGATLPAETSTLDAAPVANGPADVRWRAGKDALARGALGEASVHLLEALAIHPCSPPLLLDLVRATAGDAGAQALWCERFVRAAADQHGRVKVDANAKKTLPPQALASAQKLALLRAQAAVELRQKAERVKPAAGGSGGAAAKQALGNAAIAALHAELALRLLQDSPALLRAEAPLLAKVTSAFAPEYDVVFAALGRVLRRKPEPAAPPANGGAATPNSSPTTPPPTAVADAADLALRAARIVLGLAQQAREKDLKGPPAPPLGKLVEDAAQVASALDAETAGAARVWTVAELEQLAPPERVAFTLARRSWRSPAVAVSPNERYRVETVCGFETLLGAAKTIELHHTRLADHFAADPFAERQGTVRIVPEHGELETEGAPFWWAGGFQSGDRTVIRFAWGDIASMGRLLTHELTHRFDGVVHAFAPSWYTEGHAVWTGAHYGKMAETSCTEDFLDKGTVAHTYFLGYAAPDKLKELLAGKGKEYRDNYPAGYSLYAFLRGYPPKEPPRYADALRRFEQNLRAGTKDPVGYFTSSICDGAGGRAATFEAFCEEWEAFLRGCHEFLDDRTRKKENEWAGRYGGLAGTDGMQLVLDEPTWSWARHRAEPFFGGGHANAAAVLLKEAGEREGAAAAAVWSLTADGWSQPIAALGAEMLLAAGRKDAAAALDALRRARFAATTNMVAPAPVAAGAPGAGAAAPIGSPAAGSPVPAGAPGAVPAPAAAAPAAAAPAPFAASLPKLRAYCDALAAEAAALRKAGAPVPAAALARDHDALASLLGLPAAAEADDAPPPAPPRHLGGYGWLETSLTGYDDRREAGLWFATPEGDLHVGREKPRDGTGTVDRQAHFRSAFAHTAEWLQPGAYVLRGRVHFTTSFVSGALVFGHSRRDRGLRLHFSAGDLDYATGRSERDERFPHVGLRLAGLWERDGRLPDSQLHREVDLDATAASFAYELRIRGPRVLVLVNGTPLLRYAVHDGAPIEGHFGVAMDRGAVRVQEPTVQRLDGVFDPAAATAGLDLARQPLVPLEDLMLLPVRGVPVSPCGTLVLWLPKVDDGGPGDQLPRALPVLAKLLKDRHENPQAWVLAVPRGMEPDAVAAAQEGVRELRGERLPLLEHAVGAPFTGIDPWVLFVDAHGVLRAAAEAGDPKLHRVVAGWARLFRAR